MTWYTHAVVGANTAWLVALSNPSALKNPYTIPLAIGAASFAALLPDIDAPSAKIHYMAGGIFHGFSGGLGDGFFRHRGFFHSIPLTLIIVISGAFFLGSINPWLGFAISFGYLSHIVIDGFNLGGVGYWYPFSDKRYHLLPRGLRSTVGGPLDKFLFIAGAFGMITLLFVYWLSIRNGF